MDSKTEITQESPVLEAALEHKREFLSKDFARKMKTDVGTVNKDCELETTMKIKLENPFPYLSSQNEEEVFPKEMINKSFTCSTDSKIDLRAGIKESTRISQFYSNCERKNYSRDCVIKVENLDLKMDTQIEIKEEGWWLEKQSAPSVDNEAQGGTNEDFPSAESPRSTVEADSGDSSDESAILPDQDINLNDDPEFEKGRNWKRVTKAAAILKPVHYKHIKCGNVPSSLKQDNLVQQNNEIYNKAYECDICGKSYTKPSSLKRHSMTHEGKMPYQCNICGKKFRDLWNLSRHSFIHEGQKPYRCGVCKKEFAVRSSLKRHHLIHEGKKPHECNICKKAFIDFSHLKRHNRLVHETKNVHKCDICEKTFTYLSNLKTHSLVHEDKRPFNCSICDKSFAHLLGLKTHSHKIHSRKKDKLTLT